MIDAREEWGRAVFWHYLSEVFMDVPNSSIIEQTRELLPLIEEFEGDKAERAAKLLRSFLEECNNLPAAAIEEQLNICYTALFDLNAPVFMSESPWLSPEGLIMQEPWEQVKLTYKAFSFTKPKTFHEPDDHIGLEFLFLAALSGAIADLLEKKPEDYETAAANLRAGKKRFLERHLGKWINSFAAAVFTKGSPLNLYAGAAFFGAAMVELESTE